MLWSQEAEELGLNAACSAIQAREARRQAWSSPAPRLGTLFLFFLVHSANLNVSVFLF